MTNADYLDDRQYLRGNCDLRDEPEAVLCACDREQRGPRLSAAKFVEAAVIIDACRDLPYLP
jgi:hypothetical protein